MKMHLAKVVKSIALIHVWLILLLWAAGCGPIGPPFQGGIRMEAHAQEVVTLALVAVPGIPDEGSLQSRDGPGNGSTSLFSGETNGQGIDDIPDAVTNSHWSTDENWARFPGCFFVPPGSAGFCSFPNKSVPIGGADFSCVCTF